MEERPEEHFQSDDAELQSRSKKLLITFILGSILVLIAAIWSFVRYGQQQHSVPRPSSAAGPIPDPLNLTFELRSSRIEYWRPKPFQVSLLGPDRSTVQLSVVVEHRGDPAIKKELAKREAQIREIILFAVQSKSKAFFLTPEGKDELRGELRISINRVMRRPIDDIYFSDLIVR